MLQLDTSMITLLSQTCHQCHADVAFLVLLVLTAVLFEIRDTVVHLHNC
jgi:hypothetical protein